MGWGSRSYEIERRGLLVGTRDAESIGIGIGQSHDRAIDDHVIGSRQNNIPPFGRTVVRSIDWRRDGRVSSVAV